MINWDKVEFKNEKRFLSNMYEAPIKMELTEKEEKFFPKIIEYEKNGIINILDRHIYPSTEHVYQASKSNNPLWKQKILSIDNPHKTKTLSRKHVKKGLLFETENEFLLLPEWDEVKVEIMKLITYLKYTQNIDLAKKLLSIEGEIVERNDWGDTFWGTVDEVGENNLGKILMQMREYLRKVYV